MEEDSEPEERPRAALVAVLPPEYREYAPTQTPIAPPEREGLARPLGAGEFGRKGSSPANGRASIQVCFQGWPTKRRRATTTVAEGELGRFPLFSDEEHLKHIRLVKKP